MFATQCRDHCLQAMKIVHYQANGRFDWLMFGHKSVDLSRDPVSILSVRYKRFMFVHPVHQLWIAYARFDNKAVKHDLLTY